MNHPFSQLASLFVLTQLQQLARALSEKQDFFTSTEQERKQYIESLQLLLSPLLSPYLAKVSEQQFIKDAHSLAQDCEGGELLSETELNKILTNYLLHDFGQVLHSFITKFDTVSQHYWTLPNRQKRLTIADRKDLAQHEKAWLLKYSYQELCNALFQTSQIFSTQTPFIQIQSARECSQKLKTEIRSYYDKAFVVFMVTPNLLGGMRILSNGKLIDNSWTNQLVRLQEQVSLKM